MAAKPSPKDGNRLMCRQWWKVCFVYGDQYKYYKTALWQANQDPDSARPGRARRGGDDSTRVSTNFTQQIPRHHLASQCKQYADSRRRAFVLLMDRLTNNLVT